MILFWKVLQTFAGSSDETFGLTLSCKQTVCAAACKSSPLKCFSRDSWRPACVLQHSWLTASCFLISPVMAPPRPANSAEWYLRHKLLRFSWVELMLLCWLWSSFCMSYKRRVRHEGCSSHSRKIVRLLYYGHFLGNWCCWNPLSNVYIFMRLCVCVCGTCSFSQSFPNYFRTSGINFFSSPWSDSCFIFLR